MQMLFSKSFISSSFHVSIGCDTISLQHFIGCLTMMFEKASFVLIITGGFTIAILYLLKLMSIGVNISPMPVAYDGCGFMKKGSLHLI